jgi:hypothetical protein
MIDRAVRGVLATDSLDDFIDWFRVELARESAAGTGPQ